MKYPNLALTSFCRTAVALGLCGILVAGCGKKSGEQAAISNSQVVAHVGDQVITAQEFENELRLLNIPPDKQKEPEVVKRVLNEMVTRKYLLAQALGAKLDREPNVLLDILRSREQVLANALLSRTVAKKLSAISKADIDKYIADNPLKFAGRKLMTVDQIAFPLGANAQSIIESAKDANSLEDVDQKLTAMGIPHGRSTGTLNSSEIPDELISSMRAKKPDDVFFVRSGQNGVFLKVKSEEVRPLEGEAAVNTARQLMRNDFLKAEAGMVSVSANLEAKYEGVYSKIMTSDEGQKN
ncbi:MULTISPECIES: SurA N-terminal domain-containing protein [Bradyrhizobium]|uniref:Peptidyl-prolyl cis-trans isomerase, EpsD family n=2 Tax=Bradyrhizobium TaxID=374 RepID=A0ABY0Q7I5_9BRAD|nr:MULTISPECIES: SurA N-terminal domain-containing protein [Bradyrhizobium]SDJ64374.1 peptidyl-prolyl cis-trans isomerase, EpsD family [Bradyrhizobium ottawaense]SEC32149.1 peptidyl-prolyl cis-trans isomerase, EpsD family [Bradyrhizobium lablabi]